MCPEFHYDSWLEQESSERERERHWPKPKNTGGHKEAWTDWQLPTDKRERKKTWLANPDTNLTWVHPLAIMGVVKASSLAVGAGCQAGRPEGRPPSGPLNPQVMLPIWETAFCEWACGDTRVPACVLRPSHTNKVPAGCPRIQLNSDAIYLEMPSDFHRLRVQFYKTTHLTPPPPLQMRGASPSCYLYFWSISYRLQVQRSPPTQNANCKFRLLPVLLTYRLKSELPRNPPWVGLICCSGSENSEKHMTY